MKTTSLLLPVAAFVTWQSVAQPDSALANGVPPVAYLYDELARLTQATYPDGRQVSYTYDDMGNLTSVKTQTRDLVVPLVAGSIEGFIGVPIYYQIQHTGSTQVIGYAVTGLPPGLKVNATTSTNRDGQSPGMIYGSPTKEGTYTVRLAIRTTAGLGPTVPLSVNVINRFTRVAKGFTLVGKASGGINPGALEGGALGGWLSLSTTTSGAFTGQLQLGAAKYSFRGRFDSYIGLADPITLIRPDLSPLTLTLAMILDGPDRGQITVSLDDGTTTDTTTLFREVWSKSLPATHFAGAKSARYHLAWRTDPADTADTYPQGLGTAVITLSSNGLAKLAGKLADGAAFTQSRVVWPNGTLPVFVPLYASKGVLNGGLLLDSGTNLSPADNAASGTAAWLRPGSSGVLFASGFDTTLSVTGGVYTPPAKGQRVLGLGGGASHSAIELVLTRGGLTPAIESAVIVSTANIVTALTPNTNSLVLKFTAATGLISGSFKSGTRTAAFSGLILPATPTDPSEAYGYFLLPGAATGSPTLSGAVFVGPPRP